MIIFVTVVVSNVLLVLIGHVSPESLIGYSSALTAAYAAWRHQSR
ncbi:hypothetical protein AB9Q10_45530 [Streptomyces krungchingensis]